MILWPYDFNHPLRPISLYSKVNKYLKSEKKNCSVGILSRSHNTKHTCWFQCEWITKKRNLARYIIHMSQLMHKPFHVCVEKWVNYRTQLNWTVPYLCVFYQIRWTSALFVDEQTAEQNHVGLFVKNVDLTTHYELYVFVVKENDNWKDLSGNIHWPCNFDRISRNSRSSFKVS